MITDIVLLATVGIRVILVHGGGPEINSWLEKVGIKPEFKNGLRVTDGGLKRLDCSTWMCVGWGQLGERLWLGKVGIKPECKNGLRVTDGDVKWTKAKTNGLQDVVLP